MVGEVQPLNQWVRIAKDDGTPTSEFLRWAQDRQFDINEAITLGQAQQLIDDWAAARQIIAGVGLDGGGYLSADVTIDLSNTGVTAGAYTSANLTVDAQGRITTIANGSSSIADGDKGDITVTSGGTVWTIDNGVVSLAKMANLAANSIIGNNTGGSTTPLALTATQVTAMLNQFTSLLQGLVPASGGGTTNYLRADGSWASIPYSFGFFFTYTPAASEVLLIHLAAEAFTIPANFSSPTSRGSIGTNPSSSFVIDVKQNGVSIGSITISTGGSFTFATTSGTSKAIAAGDTLTFIAPSSADATAANCGITIRGTR